MFSVLRDLGGIVDIYFFNLGLVLEYLSSMGLTCLHCSSVLGKTGILEFWTAWVGSYYSNVGVLVLGRAFLYHF